MTALSCDPTLRDFAPYLEPAEAGSRLPALLGAAGDADACRVLYSRCRTYAKPASRRKSFLCVCYELGREGQAAMRRIYGKAYLDGRSRAEFERLQAEARLDAHPCRARLVPDLDMIVWEFPDDPRLPQLRELTDPERAARLLPWEALGLSGPDEIRDLEIEVVRYRPEQRCILRYEFVLSGGGRRVVFAKVFGDGTGAEVYERMHHIRASVLPLGVRVARPLAYSAETRAVWQEELAGAPLTGALNALATSRAPLSAVGRCLGRVHRADVPLERVTTRESRLADARKKARKLSQLLSHLAPGLDALMEHAAGELPLLAPARECAIHGDMHFEQFRLADDGQLALFDFDEWTRGDGAQDLADLIVDLHLRALAQCGKNPDEARLQGMIRIVLDGYRDGAGRAADEDAIAWHACLQFVTKAYRACIQQEPGWQEKAPAIVARALRAASRGAAIFGRETCRP